MSSAIPGTKTKGNARFSSGASVKNEATTAVGVPQPFSASPSPNSFPAPSLSATPPTSASAFSFLSIQHHDRPQIQKPHNQKPSTAGQHTSYRIRYHEPKNKK